MSVFQPDSVYRRRRRAVAECRRARRRPPARHDPAALHRHADRRGGAGAPVHGARPRSRRIMWCSKSGRIVQCVPEAKRAWHAGVSSWAGETDINSRSIGIEIVNPGHEFGYRDFPLRQIAAVISLCKSIFTRRGPISADRVLGAFRRRAVAQAGPGREIPLGAAERIRRRPLGARRAAQSRRRRRSIPATAASR